ncbi:hypothetical protein [Oricola indica]|uniref:DUF4875 domain-containing protein n=1 Tax=Oricola indica TaxID=2872591 RepID=UPI003CCBD44F
MDWVGGLAKRALLYVVVSLAVVLGVFFGGQLLFPEAFQPTPAEDKILFTEIDREDLSMEGRARIQVTIAPAAPIGPHLNSLHEVLLRQAARNLADANDADAVHVVLAVDDRLAAAPPLGELQFAPDGRGWSGDEGWTYRLRMPQPPFPEEAGQIMQAVLEYRAATDAGARSDRDLEDFIRSSVETNSAAIRSVLQPNYETTTGNAED